MFIYVNSDTNEKYAIWMDGWMENDGKKIIEIHY